MKKKVRVGDSNEKDSVHGYDATRWRTITWS